ncbi:hypothetical protein PIB30_079184 [Stylosanthes scabra]|uniref:Uncharacterized protein n=1 Tax=Stylosanthes scabra TaxID=79078 RepID=A0ABU6QQQ9_9FABA|nr:hypothetical protein [Stylosanthes scabra]
MASSSAPVSVFDEHRFCKELNQELFNSHARKRKVIPEVGFNLNEDEVSSNHGASHVEKMEKVGSPSHKCEQADAEQDELPYKSFLRGIKVDVSPSNIRRVMRFKRETTGAQTDYKTRQAVDQRLDEVLANLCIQGAT